MLARAATLARGFPVPDGADLLRLVPLLLSGGLLYWLLLCAVTAHRLMRPPRRTYGWAVARGLPGDPGELEKPLGFDEFVVRSRGRELACWDIKGRSADGPVVVLTDGWGGSRVSALGRVDVLADLASRIVVWDMPGHGDSPGVCELARGEVEDLRAVAAAVGPEAGCVYYGWSLGAEVTVRALAAGGIEARGVVLEGPFRRGLTPALAVMRQARYPALLNMPPALAWIGLRFGGNPLRRFGDLAAVCGVVGAPALVLHGSRDVTSPPEDGEAIAAALPNGSYVGIVDVGHHDLWLGADARAASLAALSGFLGGLPRVP